ncbi:hypothetical protein GQ457_04G005480 [Hibiscus cannabinus]
MEKDCKYLGIPAMWGREKKEALSFIRERIQNKLRGWKSKILSPAGRETLIKAVATAIPSYIMQSFLLPITFCQELNASIGRFWWSNSDENSKGVHWIRWSLLTRGKDFGGMGFRDFRAFNKALLAKQAWRLLQHPNSLWAQILRGIYCPSGNFLSAKKGNNPSWAWLSIIDGIETIRKGSLWRLGNGKKISIWEDRWIPSLPNFKTQTVRSDNHDFFLASHLINQDRREWKINELKSIFPRDEAKAISAIPIGSPNCEDCLVWQANSNGIYSVKSGYHSIKDTFLPSSHPCSSEDPKTNKALWRSIWRVKAPPKIQAFLWRVCNNALATYDNLSSRFKKSCPLCKSCELSPESIEHILFLCPYAQALWRASGFNYSPMPEGFPGFSKWWMEVASLLSTDLSRNHLSFIVFLCWNLWKSRNEWTFNGLYKNPIAVWLEAKQRAVEFLPATSLINEQLPADDSIQMTWNPPNSGIIKINCDASFCVKTKEACVAAVFRDCNGIFLGGSAKMISSYSVPVAEAMACRLGVSAAIREGWTNVIIESDNSGVISRLSSLSFSNWESAAVESDIISLSNGFNSISFSYVKRCCNKAADWLAKNFRHFYQLGFSFDSVLDMLNAHL